MMLYDIISWFADISCIMLQTILFTYITPVVFKLYSIMTPPPPSCRRLGFQSTIHLLISNYRLELMDNQTLCVTFKSHISWRKFSNTIYSEKFQTLILDNPKFKSCELASIWTSEHEIWWVFFDVPILVRQLFSRMNGVCNVGDLYFRLLTATKPSDKSKIDNAAIYSVNYPQVFLHNAMQ